METTGKIPVLKTFFLLFLFFFVPLLIFPFSMDSFILPKLTLICLTSLLLASLSLGIFFKPKDSDISKTGSPLFLFPILGIFITCSLTLLSTTNPGITQRMLGYLVVIILLFYQLQALLTPSLYKKLLGVSIFSGALASIYVLAQDYGWSFFDISENVPDWRFKLSGTFGNPNFVGGYLAILFFPMLGAFLKSKNKISQTLILLSILLTTAALTVTFCMGAWTGIGAAFVVGLLIWVFKKGWKKTSPKKIIAILVVFFLPLVWYLTDNPLNSHKGSLYLEAKSSPRWYSGMGARKFIWKTTSLMVKDHPLLGVGFGNYLNVHSLYQGEHYKQRWQSEGIPHDRPTVGLVNNPHNEYYHHLAETGILGVLALLWLILAIIFQTIRVGRKINPEEETEWLCALMGFIVFAVHSNVSFPFHLPASGLLALLFLVRATQEKIETSGDFFFWLREKTKESSKIIGLLLFLLFLFLGLETLKPLISEFELRQGIEKNDPSAFSSALWWDPDSYQTHFFFGKYLVSLGQPRSGIEEFKEAIQIRPSIEVYEELVAVEIQQKNWEAAIEAQQGVLKINPAYYLHWEHLSTLYYQVGDKKKAQEAEEEAKSLQEKMEKTK